jgi:branched-chain amino acid transport system substrate-binding protein
MTRHLTRRGLLAGTTAATAALAGCSTGSTRTDDVLTIGVLEDRSGNFGLVGDPKHKASLLAVEEINEAGGIDGREVEVFDPDPQSDGQRYQELTRRAINQEEVDALWAAYASPHREAIRPIVDREEQLYFYTTQYEGGVCDAYTFCVGATARQQIAHVFTHLIEKYDASTVYTLAPDYNFGHLSADWVKIIAREHDVEVLDEEFFPASVSQFGSTINRIQGADPDVIMSFLTGQNHTAFFEQQSTADLDVPIGTSTTMAQAYEHRRIDPPALENVHVGVNYMEEIDTDRNREFVESYYEMWPDAPYLNEEAQNNYFSIHMYKAAVEQAGTTDQAEVIDTLEQGIEVDAPEGDISLNGATHHMTHHMRVAKADENHEIQFSDDSYIEEQFLQNDIGCDLTTEAETTMYEPADFYDVG